MVRLLNPVGSGGASGSMGGTTYARNRYGAYARNRTSPVQPNTQLQVTVRGFMSYLVAYWASTLTTAQRAAWSLYGENVPMIGKLGAIIHLPGKEHFIRSNLPRLQAGLALVAAGPTNFSLPAQDTTITLAGTESDQNIAVAWTGSPAWAATAGAGLLVLVGRPQNGVRLFYGGPWRFGDSIDGAATPPTSPQDVASPFPFAEGQLLFCQLRVSLEDGRLSSPFQKTDTAAA